ncbi:methionyl-tRNA formyltransferase, partial [Acidobacteriota bacterium]
LMTIRAALDRLSQVEPDINIVVAYGQIIPDPIIYLPRFNSINIHFSLLPKYRGASPVQWALLNGEKKTGVTIFELNSRMDEGDILSQKQVEIYPEETSSELEERLACSGTELLLNIIKDLPQITSYNQDHNAATYAPLIKKNDGRIDWTREAIRIADQIRAFTPWPSSFCFHNQRRLKVTRGTPTAVSHTSSDPGLVLDVTKKGIDVACGSGSVIRILNLQPENKREMEAYAYSLGASLTGGDILK